MNIEQIIAYIIPALIWVLTIAITIRLVMKKQSVAAMLSWLMVIYIFPEDQIGYNADNREDINHHQPR